MNLTKAYHISDNDLDGRSALYLSKLAFSNESLTAIASDTRNIDEMVKEFVESKWEKDTLLIITDLSIKAKEVADMVDDKVRDGYQAVLIDHHPTAFWLNDYSWATVVNKENDVLTSATSMYLSYLKDHQGLEATPVVSDYVELVRSYDTWDWFYKGVLVNGEKQPNYRSKRLNDFLYIIGHEDFEKSVLLQMKSDKEEFTFSEKEEYFLDIEQERINDYIKEKKQLMKILPFVHQERSYTIAVMSAERYISELGNDICQEREDIDFVVMIDLSRKKISFRASKSDVNVGEIAKSFPGGGGHPPAGGCSIDSVTIPLFLEPLLGYSLRDL